MPVRKDKGERRKAKVKSNYMDVNDLSKRLFKFAVDVIKMLRNLNGGNDLKIISNQLGKSSTSAGANYEESQAAISKADFSYKISTSLKEMRESNYWLRIIYALYPDTRNIKQLEESDQLSKILASILIKCRS